MRTTSAATRRLVGSGHDNVAHEEHDNINSFIDSMKFE